jgi:ketosteroid isomerase-like protein
MNDISNCATVELADAVTDAFNSNDIDRVMSFFAENAVFNHAAGSEIHGTSTIGADAIRAVFGGMFERVESVKWEPIDTRVDGDKAFCQSRRTTRLPSGEVEDCHMVDILTFHDNKIIHKDTYYKRVV